MGKLDNKVAVITGATSGMALAGAKLFVDEGAYVFILGRRQDTLDAAVASIGRNVTGVRGDSANLADLDRLFETVKREKGVIDVLWASAGMGQQGKLGEITEEHFDALFSLNARGVLFTVQKALPLFADGGSILMTGSNASLRGYSFSRWFTPKLVKRWVETTESKSVEALAGIGPDGIIDAHRKLGTQPNHAAMTTALGIPEDDASPVIRAMNMTLLSAMEGPTDDDMVRSQEAISYLMHRAEQIIEDKRADRGDGMLLDELLTQVDEGTLTMREVKETVWLLWGSGGHNPGYIIDAGLILFAEQPEVFEAYKNEPESREAIVNEIIRLNAPEASIERVCSEAVEIGGVPIPAGSVFKFLLGAANRDPAVFENPDEFDYRRPKEASMNLSFGLGTHNCAGQVLARAEAKTVFDTVADRFSRVEVIGEPAYVNSDRARNIEALTVKLS